ncbi:RNA polymerase II C-terminal domain kinase beta subunit [Coemansia thaxteri]|nr:RNA polymerase II C-terminal domain kinase beta subunit [Coemansia thaxteri]KAJ2465900.1 RNA polymerase II C-terminal domain kinase beta subunit [Coemansia sp. RSA 2322]
MAGARIEPVTTDRHRFLTRGHIVSLLNSSRPDATTAAAGALPPLPPSNSAERHELLDHPAMMIATRGCVFVKEVGRSLGFPARTICTAQLLIHRTYIARSAPSISSSDLATACLFVAAKMEETVKRLKDIMAHSYLNSLPKTPSSAATRPDPQTVSTAITDKMRPSVLAGEQFVMDAIGFDFRTTHAHLSYIKLARLAGLPKAGIAADGWTILSDAYFTTLPVQYPSVVLAMGALCLAWNLGCETAQSFSSSILQSFGAKPPPSRSRDTTNGAREPTRSGTERSVADKTSATADALSSRRPLSLDLTAEWWLNFGVTTEDIQGFVRQIADFYLMFFNSTAASAEYIERHKAGLPSREMSQKIGQWRIKLSSASITPVTP